MEAKGGKGGKGGKEDERGKEENEGNEAEGKANGEMGIFKKIYYICLFETKTTFRPTLCVEPPPY